MAVIRGSFWLLNFRSLSTRNNTLSASPGAREISSNSTNSEVSTPPGLRPCRMTSPFPDSEGERSNTTSPINSLRRVSRCIWQN